MCEIHFEARQTNCNCPREESRAEGVLGQVPSAAAAQGSRCPNPNCTRANAPPQLHLLVMGEALAPTQAAVKSSGSRVSDTQWLACRAVTCGWCQPSRGVADALPCRLPGLGAAMRESSPTWNCACSCIKAMSSSVTGACWSSLAADGPQRWSTAQLISWGTLCRGNPRQ